MSETQSRPRKPRGPQQRSMALRNAIADVVSQYERISSRGVAYRLVSQYGLPKDERAFDMVESHLVKMRRDGTIPYEKIVDGTRTRRKVFTATSLGKAMHGFHQQYRRDYWQHQSVAVEVWCEKDALTGVLNPVCEEYGVPFVATRGFSSLTLLYESTLAMKARGKPTVVLYMGDHDPSGRCMSDGLEASLREFGADVTVRRLALEPDQIAMYRLPTHGFKLIAKGVRRGQIADTRAAAFSERYGPQTAELDAMPPDVMVRILHLAIREYIDWEPWQAIVEQEARELYETIPELRHYVAEVESESL